MNEGILISLQLGSTLPLAGLIWFVQIVHYPLLMAIGSEEFPKYIAMHQTLTTWVVAPLMLIELFSSVALIPTAGAEVLSRFAWVGLGLNVLIWGLTFGVHVPQHRRLALGSDRATIELLVRTNLLRTLAWTARAILLLWVVFARVA